jgi:hypothetical protein
MTMLQRATCAPSAITPNRAMYTEIGFNYRMEGIQGLVLGQKRAISLSGLVKESKSLAAI